MNFLQALSKCGGSLQRKRSPIVDEIYTYVFGEDWNLDGDD